MDIVSMIIHSLQEHQRIGEVGKHKYNDEMSKGIAIGEEFVAKEVLKEIKEWQKQEQEEDEYLYEMDKWTRPTERPINIQI